MLGPNNTESDLPMEIPDLLRALSEPLFGCYGGICNGAM